MPSEDIDVERAWNQLRVNVGHAKYERPADYGIYIISNGQGWYKIGKTNDIQRRINALQCGSPYRLNLTIFIFCDKKDLRKYESRLHQTFKSKRGIGEWFALNSPDLDYLKTLTLASRKRLSELLYSR